ncbi:hypothetical protein GCM10010253_64990 [Streptomyces badius]|uniref:O-methyltransferase C-terminal domain-containing protein n=1 Tax=Streptomyces badius TaxID=1941 RepID=A0ABQ2TNS2_STRBA|nr:hypothetical protein GCM10010253_64990 [Streptomyces badius]
MLRGWNLLDESVRTGRTTFDMVFGTDFFGHLKEHPELSAAFNEAMTQGTRLTAATVPHHDDFGRFGTLVDIGGGDGTLPASVCGSTRSSGVFCSTRPRGSHRRRGGWPTRARAGASPWRPATSSPRPGPTATCIC